MIKLPQGWCSDADKWNYVLYVPQEGKDGKTRMTKETYHQTIGQALARYYKTVAREMVAGNDMEIVDAMRKVVALTDEIRGLRKSVEKLEFSSKEVASDD